MSDLDPFWIPFREKLANLDHVPGEPLPDDADLWKRVKQRLQRAKRRRRMFRYGIGAALVVMISLFIWFMTK